MNLRTINIGKTLWMTIALHALQILALLSLWFYWLFGVPDRVVDATEWAAMAVLMLMTLINSGVSTRYVLAIRREMLRSDTLEDALEQVEQLSNTMRAQRHDFLNHLQIVYGLIELGDQSEALDYIRRTYGDIRSISRVLRTECLPVNALLQAKYLQAQQRGIELFMDIRSTLRGFPIPEWEICRVLGNLLDNAIEVLDGRAFARISLSIDEDLSGWRIDITNNGPQIPEQDLERIFTAGFTTRFNGQGMGLHIVRRIVQEHQSSIELTSDQHSTRFRITIPRPAGARSHGQDDSSGASAAF